MLATKHNAPKPALSNQGCGVPDIMLHHNKLRQEPLPVGYRKALLNKHTYYLVLHKDILNHMAYAVISELLPVRFYLLIDKLTDAIHTQFVQLP